MSDKITPIQQSRIATGRRFYRCPVAVYQGMSAAINKSRGYPSADTLRMLPLVATMPTTDGDVLVSISTHRVSEAEETMLARAITAGHVVELTEAEYKKLKPADESLT